MKIICSFYDKLIHGCLFLSGVTIFVIVGLVVSNVVGRVTGLYYMQSSVALSEYGLQFATMLAAPAVLRSKGHIFLTIVFQYLPRRAQALLEQAVYLVSLAICVVVTYFSVTIAVQKFVDHVVDIRSIDLPGWILFATLAFGFGLMAVEFAMYSLGPRSMFDASERTS